jgi:hypothetical protein
MVLNLNQAPAKETCHYLSVIANRETRGTAFLLGKVE